MHSITRLLQLLVPLECFTSETSSARRYTRMIYASIGCSHIRTIKQRILFVLVYPAHVTMPRLVSSVSQMNMCRDSNGDAVMVRYPSEPLRSAMRHLRPDNSHVMQSLLILKNPSKHFELHGGVVHGNTPMQQLSLWRFR